MASVWFSVIVLVSIQKVFGDGCLKDKTDYSCNECIRCGGNWCNERRVSLIFLFYEYKLGSNRSHGVSLGYLTYALIKYPVRRQHEFIYYITKDNV